MEIFDKVNDKLMASAAPAIAFYTLVNGGFLGDLYPCQMQNLLKRDVRVKHAAGFVTVWIAILATSGRHRKLLDDVKAAAMVYGGIVVISKAEGKHALYSVAALTAAYLIQRYNGGKKSLVGDDDEGECTDEAYRYLQQGLVALALLALGKGLYDNISAQSRKASFNLVSFLLDKPTC